MLKWIQKDHLLFNNDPSSGEQSIWAEWSLVEVLFQSLD